MNVRVRALLLVVIGMALAGLPLVPASAATYGHITGLLTGPDGAPRDHLQVEVWRVDPTVKNPGLTEGGLSIYRSGQVTSRGYVSQALPTGVYRVCVIVEDQRWQSSCYGGSEYVDQAHDIRVAAPYTSGRRSFALPTNKDGILAGRVVDSHDQPVSGATVRAQRQAVTGDAIGFDVNETTTTDSSGHYSISVPAHEQDYSVSFLASGYEPKRYPGYVSVFQGQTTTLDDSALTPGAFIRGTVHGPGGAALTHDLQVSFAGRSVVVGPGAGTDTYAFDNLNPGTYRLSVGELPGDLTPTSDHTLPYAHEVYNGIHDGENGTPTDITLAEGQTLTGVDVTLEAGATITGRIVDTGGQPLSGYRVRASSGNLNDQLRYADTGDDGSFTLRGLGSTSYFLDVSRAPGAPVGGKDAGDQFYSSPGHLVPGGAHGQVSTTLGQTTDLGTLSYTDYTPRAVHPPTVSGVRRVGAVLTAGIGNWAPEAAGSTYTYTWRSGNTVLGHAPTLRLPAALLGHRVAVRVTATSPTGRTTTAQSAYTLPIARGIFDFYRNPGLRGLARVHHHLILVREVTLPLVAHRSYQWLRDGHPIRHATGYSRLLTRADRGHRLSLRVRFSRAGFTSTYRTTHSYLVTR